MQLRGPFVLVAGAGVLALLLAAWSLAAPGGLRRVLQLRREVARQTQVNQALARENEALARRARLLQNPPDRSALEREAREQLGLVKQDEIVFKFE